MKNPNLIILLNRLIHSIEKNYIEINGELLTREQLIEKKNKALKILIESNNGERVMYYTTTLHNKIETLYSLYIEKADKTGFFKFHVKDISILEGIEYRGSEGSSTSRTSDKRKMEFNNFGFYEEFKKEFNF